MEVLELSLGAAPIGRGRPVVTIGNFDGLHLGHRKIVGQAVSEAERTGERSAVLTFEPHPVQVLQPEAPFCRLLAPDQRLAELARTGVDLVLLVRFEPGLAATSAREFATGMLHRTVGASLVLVGPVFRFGHRRQGDFAALVAYGRELGFAARAVRPLVRAGLPVSSTRIRAALADGEVALAARLLGRPHALEATVVPGARRGAGLGFPTANLAPPANCRPGPGVYATRAELGGRTWAAATFVGAPATFGDDRPVIESHLLDFPGGELYGQRLRLHFLARLRGPRRFPSAEALGRQIARDLKAVRSHVRLAAQPGGPARR